MNLDRRGGAGQRRHGVPLRGGIRGRIRSSTQCGIRSSRRGGTRSGRLSIVQLRPGVVTGKSHIEVNRQELVVDRGLVPPEVEQPTEYQAVNTAGDRDHYPVAVGQHPVFMHGPSDQAVDLRRDQIGSAGGCPILLRPMGSVHRRKGLKAAFGGEGPLQAGIRAGGLVKGSA